MIRKRQRLLNAFNAVSDGLLILLCYLFATWLWLDVLKQNDNMAAVDNLKSGMGLAAALYALLMMLMMACFGLYKPARIRSIGGALARVWEANALGLLLVASALYLFRLQEFSRGVLVCFYLSACFTLSLKYIFVRMALREMRARGYNQKHVLVVGAGNLAAQYAASIACAREMGYHIAGHLAPKACEQVGPYCGEYTQLEQCLRGRGIDEVVVALEPEETQYITQVIHTCEKCGTKISVIPFYNDIIPTKPSIEVIGSVKLINLRTTPLDNIGNAMIKRGFDVIMSALFILLSSPFMLLAAVGTKLSSPGPILFRQERVGRNKKPFTMLKFRSMRVNAVQDTAWTTNNDPRKTKFGSFLRKTSIDELPQFFNVLKGDMSLIGPRPEIPHYVEQFRESVPLYMVKHQVRPGITGWAQVNGYRGDTSIVERIHHDLWYIENWSFGLDLKIIMMTVFGGMINKEQIRKQGEEEQAA